MDGEMGDGKRGACCAALLAGRCAVGWNPLVSGFHAMTGMTPRLKPRSGRPAFSSLPHFTRFCFPLLLFRFCFSPSLLHRFLPALSNRGQ